LGNPAIVKKTKNKDKEGKTFYTSKLTLMILSKTDKLNRGQVASHLKISTWASRDHGDTVLDKTIQNIYVKDITCINVSPCVKADPENLGQGLKGKDRKDNDYGIKFSHTHVFPWILAGMSNYPYLFKVSIDLKNIGTGLYNIWWVNTEDYIKVRERPKWWNLISHMKDWALGASRQPRAFKRELKEFSDKVVDDPINKEKNENIKASIYHPFFVSTKEKLDIGHVTDIHLDSRMDLYAQSEASVIEVSENCPPSADGDKRKIVISDFHVSIKDKIANFNKIFMDICNQLIGKGADILVITGDLVDYNRGIHTVQTHQTCFKPISEMWDALSSNVSEENHYRDDRNWFLFYKKLLEFYDREDAVPVFTILGNHDYVNYGMAPWPVWGLPWNGVFDQNLTLYESALCFGEGYNSSKAFVRDVIEKSDYVEWYTIFINPFTDFVVNYGDQSMLMVDWGVKSNIATSILQGSGGLHHARHLFQKKTDFDRVMSGAERADVTVINSEPFPIRNFAIYESWVKQDAKVKMLFMHATGICPKDDVSIGQINYDLKWTDSKMCYGSFDHRRDTILTDVEKGDLSIIVAGHSHRNVVMQVDQRHTKKVKVLGAGETYGTVKHSAKNLVMVTSSGGPLPKYLPGGPKICACPEKYAHGWDYEKHLFSKNRFYEYTYGDTKEDLTDLGNDNHKCPRCQMMAKDMTDKKPKRHRPGGSLLSFDVPSDKNAIPTVTIESVPTNVNGGFPRRGVLND
jgi:UDP-2,3-diacylglucosamine pyrophosphatase LpxH